MTTATGSPDPAEAEFKTLRPLEMLDRYLLDVLDNVRDATGSSRASLFLRDPVSGEAVTHVAHLEEASEIRLPPGEGIVGEVLTRDTCLTWPGDAPEPHRAAVAATAFEPRTVLAVPVRMGGRAVGVLELLDGSTGRRAQRAAAVMAERLATMLADSCLVAQLLPRGEQRVPLHYAFEGVVGASQVMKTAFRLAERVAPTDASVLITGETGTGKELFARALHANSTRADGPLVKVDCGAIPDSLIENELFGHARGAYTGAMSRARGRVEQAHGGTLFLDEVGELSPAAQLGLLRVLEDRVIQPLGSERAVPVEFRVLAATHRDLEKAVGEGRFRPDLYHRLKVVEIRLPTLRERGSEDILRLTEHFVDLHSRRHGRPVRSIPSATQRQLAAAPWPGNVRQLSHAIESAVVLSEDGVISTDLFSLGDGGGGAGPQGPHPFDDLPTVAELERRYLVYLLERFGDRKSEVARVAGIGRSTLWRRLRELGLDRED